MYSRKANSDGSPLTFGVSGKLWHGVLVMFDRESGSLWTQLDGRSIQGDASGQRLAHVPSVFTTWAEWKAEHPDTLVLDKSEEERGVTASHYADYFADPDQLYFSHLDEDLGGVAPTDVIYGVVVDGQALAVTEELLLSKRIVNATIARRPIALLHDEATGFPISVELTLAGRALIAVPIPGGNPALLFEDALTGEVHGPDELEPLRVDRAYWYAWARSHPGSLVLAD